MNDAKERFCWHCGESLGVIERKYYDRMDVCGKNECLRELRNALADERAEAHRKLDEERGWQ